MACTKNLNKQTEFKVAVKDDVLGFYDTLTPLYAAFHENDKTFSLMWTKYCNNFTEFNNAYTENQKVNGDVHGVLSQPQTPPPANAYTVSCIPWVKFNSFSLHSYDNKPYYFPSVESGKFFRKDDKLFMPLSLTCHHATTDGYHISKFLCDLQEDMNSFEQFI